MEDGSSKVTISSFLSDSKTKELFAKIDYTLKNGGHIQRYGKQIELYDYIVKNEPSLKIYYQELFGVKLDFGGELEGKYYYLDFQTNKDRGNIQNKNYLKNEFIIIGFILYEIIYINKEIDLNSISELQKKIRTDYEDIKPGIYRLIAKSKNKNPGKINDDTIDNTVKSALKEFDKIGWVTITDNNFELLPAFDRLIKFYENEIINIYEIFKELQ